MSTVTCLTKNVSTQLHNVQTILGNLLIFSLLILSSQCAIATEAMKQRFLEDAHKWIKVETREGCGLYITKPDEKYVESTKKSYSMNSWEGDCIRGLAMGPGFLVMRDENGQTLGISDMWLFYGRKYGHGTYTSLTPGEYYGRVNYGFSWGVEWVYRNFLKVEAIEPQPHQPEPALGYYPEDKTKQLSISLLAECAVEKKPCIVENRYSPENYFAGRKQILCDGPCGQKWVTHIKELQNTYERFVKENESKVLEMQKDIEPLLDPTFSTKSKRQFFRHKLLSEAESQNLAHLQKLQVEKQNEIIKQQREAGIAQIAEKEETNENLKSLLDLVGNIATGLIAIQDARNTSSNSVRQDPQIQPPTRSIKPATISPPVTTTSINPYANNSSTAVSNDMTRCLSVTTHSQGKFCGDPTSYAVAVTNTCNTIMAAEVCIKRLNGTGNCGRNSDLRPGQSQSFWSCEATNVYKYLGCEHYTKNKDQPACSIMKSNAVWQD